MSNYVKLYCTDYEKFPSEDEKRDFIAKSGDEFSQNYNIPLFWFFLFSSEDIKYFDSDGLNCPYLINKRKTCLEKIQKWSEILSDTLDEEKQALLKSWIAILKSEEYKNIIVDIEEMIEMSPDDYTEALVEVMALLDKCYKNGKLEVPNGYESLSGVSMEKDKINTFEDYEYTGFSRDSECLEDSDMKDLVPNIGGCIASDTIMISGSRVAYMERYDSSDEVDTGWVFFGEEETQEYVDNPDNFNTYSMNTIANYDPEIIPFLTYPVGTVVERNCIDRLHVSDKSIPKPKETFLYPAQKGFVDLPDGWTFEIDTQMYKRIEDNHFVLWKQNFTIWVSLFYDDDARRNSKEIVTNITKKRSQNATKYEEVEKNGIFKARYRLTENEQDTYHIIAAKDGICIYMSIHYDLESSIKEIENIWQTINMNPQKDDTSKELEKELEILKKRQLVHVKNRYSLNKAEMNLYEGFLYKKMKLKEATKEELFLFVEKIEEDDVDIQKIHEVIDEQYPREDEYSEEDDIKNAYKSHRKHLDSIKQKYALNESEVKIYDKYIYAWIEKGSVSVERICDMVREIDASSINLEKLDNLISKEFDTKIEDELTWSETTEGDMLTLALRELDEGLGIVSSKSGGYAKELAWSYTKMLLEDYSSPMGYIYSTDQEIRRCLINMEMSFYFGDVQGDEKESIEIGKKITEVFDEYDIQYDWDGTASSTIDVYDHCWQSRSNFSSYGALNDSQKAKKAFEKLVDMVVVDTEEKERILEFEDKSDIDDMLTSMLAFVDENDLSFTIWVDWKEEVESLRYQIERFLDKNYKKLKIALPYVDDEQVVSDDGVFAVFDEVLRKNGLQLGFIDGESDAYIAIIHQTEDKNAIKNLVNKMGYEYMEEDEACEGSAKDQTKGVLVEKVKDITGEVLEFKEPFWYYKFTMKDLRNIYNVMDECFGNCKIIVNGKELESLGDIEEFDVVKFELKCECKHRFATFVIEEDETKLLSTMDDSFEKGDVTDILITKVHEVLKETKQNANFFASYKFYFVVNAVLLGVFFYLYITTNTKIPQLLSIFAVSNVIFYGIFKKFRKNMFDFREDEEEFEEEEPKKESIPHFLKKFEKELEPYKKECVKITATPKDENPLKDEMPLTKSKFFGLPFYPKSKEYPKDAKGLPMVLAAQINFEEIPHLEDFPKDGILQLFLSGVDWYMGDENYKIVYLSKSELELENIEDFSFIAFEKYDDIPIDEVHELTFKKAIENGSTNDFRFDFSFDGMDMFEFEDALNEKDRDIFNDYFDADGHKIGGYSQFTQNPQYAEVQLLQIDVDQQIMFGDSGIAHIFISKEDLKNRRFDKAYFYWDCC